MRKKIFAALNVFVATVLPKANGQEIDLSRVNEAPQIILPGQQISVKNKIHSYEEISAFLKKFESPNAKTNKISIQDEDSTVDFAFLDNNSIVVSSERKRDGAPPNADGAFAHRQNNADVQR